MPNYNENNNQTGRTSNHQQITPLWTTREEKKAWLELRRAFEGIPFWYPTGNKEHEVGENHLFDEILSKNWIYDPWDLTEHEECHDLEDFYWPDRERELLKEGYQLSSIYEVVDWLLSVEKLDTIESEELKALVKSMRQDVEEWAPSVPLRKIVFYEHVDWDVLGARLKFALIFNRIYKTLRPHYNEEETVELITSLFCGNWQRLHLANLTFAASYAYPEWHWQEEIDRLLQTDFGEFYYAYFGFAPLMEKEHVEEMIRAIEPVRFAARTWVALVNLEQKRNEHFGWLTAFRWNDERKVGELSTVTKEIMELVSTAQFRDALLTL